MKSFNGVCSCVLIGLDPLRVFLIGYKLLFSNVSSSYKVTMIEILGPNFLVVFGGNGLLNDNINKGGETSLLV